MALGIVYTGICVFDWLWSPTVPVYGVVLHIAKIAVSALIVWYAITAAILAHRISLENKRRKRNLPRKTQRSTRKEEREQHHLPTLELHATRVFALHLIHSRHSCAHPESTDKIVTSHLNRFNAEMSSKEKEGENSYGEHTCKKVHHSNRFHVNAYPPFCSEYGEFAESKGS